jgi:hypothetical protein
MNIAKKAFCRVFQKVMHLLIPIFPYREPKILDSTEQIADLLKSNNIERVMLVTDKGIRGLGLCAPLENHLEKNGINSAKSHISKR